MTSKRLLTKEQIDWVGGSTEAAKAGMPVSFGMALDHIEKGGKVARKGWNGKGMFVYYVPPAKYPASRNELKTMASHADSEGMIKYNAYMAIKNVDGTVSTWVPSVNDCFADDWELLG